MTTETAFWIVWALCGLANFNAYVDSPNRQNGRVRMAVHLLLCVLLGPITTIIGVFVRAYSLALVGKWAVPRSPTGSEGEEQ